MANITRIKAGSGGKQPEKKAKSSKPSKKDEKKLKNNPENSKKAPETTVKKPENKKAKKQYHLPKPILFITAPFRTIGRYLRDSWHELRQVRWTNRKTTWKIVFAVFIYTALFVAIIMLLDIFFTFIFNLILGK